MEIVLLNPISLIGAHLTFDAEFSSRADLNQFSTSFANGDRILWNNKEQEWYVDDDPSNPANPFSVSNGALTITARPTPAGGQAYTSGLLQTSSTFSQTQGYFEIRAQTTNAQGMWPAFWMLPQGAGYPEIDVLEQPNNTGTTDQYWLHTGTPTDSSGGFQSTGVNLSAGYHSYGFYWGANTIQYAFDGNLISDSHSAPPDLAALRMYMLLNLAVGNVGGWPGPPVPGSSGTYKIDYVRAYSWSVSDPAVIAQAISSPDGVNTAAALVPPAPPTPTSIGSGSDSLVLQISEDAWNGDAQFTVSIDGQQIGGIQTAQASKTYSQSQAFTVLGSFGTGIHRVSVIFLNDAYGGPGMDRNLFVTGAAINGTPIDGAGFNELPWSSQDFTFKGTGVLTGGAGNDIFYGGNGNTTVDGGAGVNTMTYPGLRSSYSSTVSSEITHVVGATNSDTLVNMQQLSFADGIVAVASLAVGPSTPAFTTASVITNNPTPVFAGKAENGSSLTLRSNGTVVGSATADAATGAFTVTPNAPLAFGRNTLSATSKTVSGTSDATAPVSLFKLQAPVEGISTTGFSSADLGAALSQGAKLAFISGTEAILLTDATLSVGPNTNQATIQRLYQGLLGRGSDTGGISTFDAQLTAGASKADVASSLLNSSEYVAAHGTQTNDQLIATLYQGLLGRLPEAAAFASWNDQLAHGASRGSVAIGIADSNEAKSHLASTTAKVYVPDAVGTLVHKIYKTGLGREVELTALPSYKATYAPTTLTQIAASVAGSAEFMNHHIGQSNSAYVSSLYHDGLGRAPDAAGSAFWTTQLDSGNATRSGVLLSLATSGEAAAHLTYNLSS